MNIIPRKNRQNNNAISLRDAMNQMFDESFWDPWKLWNSPLSLQHNSEIGSVFVPNIDITEKGNKITLTADLPGYDPKDIDVSIEDNVLTIQGTMQTENEDRDEDKKWYRKECSSGSFFQQFKLPSTIKESDISCKAKNGKLTVVIPKNDQMENSSKKSLPIDTE